MAAGRSSTGISPRPMLMGAADLQQGHGAPADRLHTDRSYPSALCCPKAFFVKVGSVPGIGSYEELVERCDAVSAASIRTKESLRDTEQQIADLDLLGK